MLLQLTDGANTVTLSGDGGAVRGCTYFPQGPQRGAEGAEAGDVTETAEITLRGPQTQVRGAVNAVERMLHLAAARQAGEDAPRVWVQYAPVDGEPPYRSEALEGRVTWSSDPGLRRLGDGTPTVQAAVIWRRRPFWEGPETALPQGQITNGDGGSGSAVLWNGVEGTLPAPLRIALTNASGVPLASHRFYIQNDAADVFGALGAFFYPAQAAASWDANLRPGAPLWRIDIPAASLAKLKGERRRILAAFDGLTESIHLRAVLYAAVGGVLLPMQTGPEVRVGGPNGRELLDLGALNLPPAGDIGAPAACTLALTGWASMPGMGVMRWVHIGPAAPSVTLRQQGFWLGAGQSVVHDGMEGVSYLALEQRHPVVEAAGELTLRPNQPNRVRILFDEGVLFEPARALTVTGAYRPRRATV